jgi:hypothetical protein
MCVLFILLSLVACTSRPQLPQVPLVPKPKPKSTPTQPSNINVKVSPGGPAVFTTSAAEFQVRPDGYVQAFLLQDVRKLSLDEPRVGAPAESDYVVVDGKDVHFILDFQQAQELETIGAMGVGKRLNIPARPLGPSGMYLHRTLVLEAYDKFPNVLFSAAVYENTGATALRFEKAIDQRHRLSAKMAGQGEAWELWSYHRLGGEDKGEVVRVAQKFSRRNALDPLREKDAKDLPVVAAWTGEVGEAVGEADATPVDSAIPVRVAADGRVDVQLESVAKTMLKPTETYSTPRNFLCVYRGDGAEPEHLLSALPPKPGAEPAKAQPSTQPPTQH